MEIVVRGKNCPVSRHLRAVSRAKVARIERFAHDVRRVEVEFSEIRNPRESRPRECEVTVHLTGHLVKARAAAREAEAALDLVLDKVEQRVARIKDKRVTRVHVRRSRAGSNGHAVAEVTAPPDALAPDDEGGPRIVRAKRFATKPMPPAEAALQMDLLGHAFFVFANSETGRAAVLYRRDDGDLGLIETTT